MIIVGPVPIVFGTDKESIKTALALALALTVLAFLAIIAFYLIS